jgi:dTDP-4-amino-4,6-dideoxygalactose transaminase
MDSSPSIVFNRPYITKRSLTYVEEAVGLLWGKGKFTHFCEAWLEQLTHCRKALLTTSCTAALELTALLLDIQPGDEVIMPSYTFVSTANAFATRGAVPVFVDIRPDTLNIDESLIEQAITARTKAIVVVHYGGVACFTGVIRDIADRHGLILIEDAAHSVMARMDGKPLGSTGHMAVVSFHETKNITCGQGGALLINDEHYIERARVLHDKGTNRVLFMEGKVDNYSWVDIGSNYILSEIGAAFLQGQMEEAEYITRQRRHIWEQYHVQLAPLETVGLLQRPQVPEGCEHNGHIYYVLLPDRQCRDYLLAGMHQQSIHAVFHYTPLHLSLMGKRLGRVAGGMDVTEAISQRLVRLPLFVGLDPYIPRIIEATERLLSRAAGPTGVYEG